MRGQAGSRARGDLAQGSGRGARRRVRRRCRTAAPTTPAEYYLAAQRMLIRIPADGDVGPVLALLSHAVAGHAGSDAALALGESLLRRQAAAPGEGGADGEAPSKPLEARMIDLLRAAFDSEDRPSRHGRIADRLAAALELDGDPAAALAVLDRAITAGVLEVLLPLRRRRARLLRQLGRSRDLATALADRRAGDDRRRSARGARGARAAVRRRRRARARAGRAPDRARRARRVGGVATDRSRRPADAGARAGAPPPGVDRPLRSVAAAGVVGGAPRGRPRRAPQAAARRRRR